MPMTKNKKSKRQKSLRTVLIRFTYLLIVAIVLSVSIQTGYKNIALQQSTLAQALEERSQVLMESLSANVKSFMPGNNYAEISALPQLKSAMSEIKYVTIVGQNLSTRSNKELAYKWATDNPEFERQTTNANGEPTYGEKVISDERVEKILERMKVLENEVRNEVLSLEENMTKLQSEYSLASDEEKEIISTEIAKTSNQIANKLSEYASKYSSSLPHFDKEKMSLRTSEFDYVFYRPVLYRQGSSKEYVHAVIIMELSIESLISQIRLEAKNIVVSAAIIAVIAVIIGLLGSFLFASFIIKPIKILEEFVDRFGRAKKKKIFSRTNILIIDKKEDRRNKREAKKFEKEENKSEGKKSKRDKKEIKEKEEDEKILLKDDEVGRLGTAINTMKEQIIANEIEQNLLLDGSEVQNAFMPLEKGSSYAQYEDKNIQTFGYYLAQSGVSGDYFDYKKLEGDWYLFIKSDASGHGSPAAFIMTVVAIFFQEYVKNWSYKKNGTRINDLVYQINDFISKLGLRGKFATVIVALLNVKTGELYLCDAGDNLVNIYRNKTRKVEVITLNSSPTTGVFDSDMIRMGSGYKVEKFQLEKEDVLFLYTDGIEESTRRMRFADFSVQVTESEKQVMDPVTHKPKIEIKTEDIKEEFGPDRVRSIIEAVFAKQKFILTKDQNPMPNETLEFDFTKSDGSLHDVIYALASTEKVFRMYKPAGLHSGIDDIQIDAKIDDFLKIFFNRYDLYAKHREEDKEKSNFVIYEHMREDEQGDDLTLFAIKRL